MSTSSLNSAASDGSFYPAASPNLSTAFDKCPRCKIQFDFLKRVNVTRVPLILTCKHIVCEDCIRRMFMINNTVCPVCKVKFRVPREHADSLTDLFPPHYTLIGQLVWAKNSSAVKKSMTLVPTGITLANRNSLGCDLSDLQFDTDVKSEDSDDDLDRSTSLIFDKCLEHTDQFLNIYCEECEDASCSYCFLENHNGHKATSLYKLNDAEMAELEKLKVDVEVVLAEFLVSRKQVKELKNSDSSIVDFDIKNYFIELSAKLHLAEHNIRKRLLSMESEEADLELVNATLKSGMLRVNKLVRYFNLLDSKQVNMRALYEQVKEIRNIPCKLISDQGGIRPIEFLSDSVFDDIEDTIYLKDVPHMEYNLVPIEDWSLAEEKYEMDQIRQQSQQSQQMEQSVRETIVKTLHHAESEVRRTSSGKYRVVVTHLNNLDSFFVQRYSALDCLEGMNDYIGKRSKRSAREDFKLGGIYGVLYETKNSSQWRRGKLMEISKNSDKHRFKMYFLDYGNTQYVTKDKLKMLDVRTVNRPSFATECKLTNPDKIEFKANAHLQLPQIIEDKELYVHYMNTNSNRNNVQEVDLLIITSNGGFISVRDFLIKTPIPVPVSQRKNSMPLTEFKLFANSKRFSPGQEEKVIVTYIRDPSYICVQMVRNLNTFHKMKDEMDEYYKNTPGIPCIPMANTDMAVKYEDENQGKWHRAKIISVDMVKKEVGVFFVDWGYSTVVSWLNLRLLTEDFIKAESMGIIVKLAHVEKLDMNIPWRQEATDYLREQIGKEVCKMVAASVEPLEVALFQSRPSADVCLNALLVERKFALSTGPLSQTTLWPNMLDSSLDEDDNDLALQMVKKSEEIIMSDDEDSHLQSGVKLQVSVLNFQSPDSIQIKFHKYKETEEEMQKELQIHYSSRKTKTKNWKIGDKCVIFDSIRNNYFRAVVKSVAGKDNYVVYLYDDARELKVSKNVIFVQDAYFQRPVCYVCKCRLSNVKPAGDKGKWSSLAIEMLQKIFALYKTIYIKKMEVNRQNKMLGVIMWYCLTTPAKALEPSKVKYISINQALLESGVAFVSLNQHPKNVSLPSNNAERKDWYSMICEDERKTETRHDFNEKIEQEEEEESVQNAWPKPYLVDDKEFTGILTCVDNDGFFSIRPDEMQTFYLELEEALTTEFNSTLLKKDDEWEVGDICTITCQGKWYRGTVLEIRNDEEISVEMIDFGSEHVVRKGQITKCVMFIDIAPLIYKVKLYDVFSQNKHWSGEDVNDVLSIVSENVRVIIKEHTESGPCAEIILENGLSLNDLVTQKCPHMIRHQSTVSLGVVNNVKSNTEYKYNYVCFSNGLRDKQKLFVVNVLKWDSSYYNVVLSTQKNTFADEFIGSDAHIQNEAAKQPSLKKIELGEPCICMHVQKKLWSRAAIYNTDSLKYGFILAFFVDYGTVEMVAANKNVKEMKPEWLQLPVYMQIASINIELLQSTQAEYVLMKLNSLRGRQVEVDVVNEQPLKVHLYVGENLFYQDFIDCGIVRT